MRAPVSLLVVLCTALLGGCVQQNPDGAGGATRLELKPWGYKVFVQ
ncbi:MAG: hypothetical protein ACJ74T_23850 [Pyrinomonadaceae bacterium]